MRKSLLYFSGGETDADEAVNRAASLFLSRFGRRPTWAVVNASTNSLWGARIQPVECMDGAAVFPVELRGENYVLPGLVWVGDLERKKNHELV